MKRNNIMIQEEFDPGDKVWVGQCEESAKAAQLESIFLVRYQGKNYCLNKLGTVTAWEFAMTPFVKDVVHAHIKVNGQKFLPYSIDIEYESNSKLGKQKAKRVIITL